MQGRDARPRLRSEARQGRLRVRIDRLLSVLHGHDDRSRDQRPLRVHPPPRIRVDEHPDPAMTSRRATLLAELRREPSTHTLFRLLYGAPASIAGGAARAAMSRVIEVM